jgi:hypothetical protein
VLPSKSNGHEISSRQRTVNASIVCSLQLATKSGLPTSPGLLGFRLVILLASTKVLRIEGFWLSNVLSRLGFIRIVALEEVAGSSPVGHPPVFRIGKRETRKRASYEHGSLGACADGERRLLRAASHAF